MSAKPNTVMTSLNRIFSANGLLSQKITGYQPRSGQIEMASAIAEAIDNEHTLIAEAGTGTGKTFAYLIPAILSEKKVIISTGSKNLQDQLFNKDLPIIRKALSIPFLAALLKGRSNYLCKYRLRDALEFKNTYSKPEARALAQINRWAQTTRVGDTSELGTISETDPIWQHATSTLENCLGQECPDYAECFLVKARKAAQECDILVVNHHLLCADWSVKDTGFGQLLPDADVIIIDEAHHLADTASNFLGASISSKSLIDLSQDTLIEYLKDATDIPALRSACEKLDTLAKDLRLAFGVEAQRGDWQDIDNKPELINALQKTKQQLLALTQHLELAAVKTKALEICFKRADSLLQQFSVILDDASHKWIRWYETYKKTVTLNRTPLDITSELQFFMQQSGATWIFTSATLSVAQNFDYFANTLGLTDTVNKSWNSPFDYPKQSLFYHPKGLPLPNAPDFVERVVEFAIPVLQASQGRAFFLFTSHRALQKAADLLIDQLDYPLLVQGSQSKGQLLQQFTELGNAVLLGTASFWEGVDVRGEALSCVIIDKLPFASPGNPVLKARLNAMSQQGRDPFYQYQVPVAITALRQGIGRLIRDVNDRGVLMICDRRLLKNSYGQLFLDSIPPMRRTRDIDDVWAFFQS